jgi:uncharacterized protein (TIGR02118 family)
MSAQLVVLYHTPVDPTAFEQYYQGAHVPLAKQIPGLRSYTINKGPIASPAGASPYFLVATLAFDSLDALQSALGSPEGGAAAADVPNFATGGVTMLMFETTAL